MPIRFAFAMLALSCAALLSSCAGFPAVPGEAGKDAKSTNLWPLFKSVSDEKAKLSETQVLWPFFKTRTVGEESMTRFWPLFYSRSGPEAFEGETAEGAMSSLAAFSFTSAPSGEGRLGILHPWILNIGGSPMGKDGSPSKSGFTIFPYTAFGAPTFGRVLWPRKDLFMALIPIYYKTIEVTPPPGEGPAKK